MAEFKVPIEISDKTMHRIAETVAAEMRKDYNADWVEAARHRDCYWYDQQGGRCWNRKITTDSIIKGDFYCADGERGEK